MCSLFHPFDSLFVLCNMHFFLSLTCDSFLSEWVPVSHATAVKKPALPASEPESNEGSEKVFPEVDEVIYSSRLLCPPPPSVTGEVYCFPRRQLIFSLGRRVIYHLKGL